MRKVAVVWFLLIMTSGAFAQNQTPDPSKWMCRNLADSGGFTYQGETLFGNQACRPVPQSASPAPTTSKQDATAPTPTTPTNNTALVSKQENATAAKTATSPTPESRSESIAATDGARQHFNFERGQRVYVVAVSTRSRDLDVTKSDLEVERDAREQFKKSKQFMVASTLRGADFVFFILFDSTSSESEEMALAVSPDDYQKYGSNLDALRNAALWQSSNHLNVGRHTALAGATIGVSVLFDHPSVAKGLVKRFQDETISK